MSPWGGWRCRWDGKVTPGGMRWQGGQSSAGSRPGSGKPPASVLKMLLGKINGKRSSAVHSFATTADDRC
ncbi:hypothetical protein E2562_004879 [Oryza meyeriana var. granulata]|uniref:Uncharacterized protein n=1 Tax=Oryza meyeriana var. granulata TaxID=110450 RepID=A0A6G1C4B9_9ORYZ|nr:hypothetical protein E2562_004879 [Oryza meyeriana var. granulata]